MVAVNLQVGRGEVDIVAIDRGVAAVVEVRTVTGVGDPMDSFDDVKLAQVYSLAATIGVGRVDFISVAARLECVEIRWLPRI